MSDDSSDNGRLLIRLDERTKRIEEKLDGMCKQNEKRYDDIVAPTAFISTASSIHLGFAQRLLAYLLALLTLQ